jgi:hypothetical protein
MTTDSLFPYPNFHFRVELKKEKDKRICWFECQEHVNRFVTRQNLKKKDYTLNIKSHE